MAGEIAAFVTRWPAAAPPGVRTEEVIPLGSPRTAGPRTLPAAPPGRLRRLGHVPALDGFRGVAVIVVAIGHLSVIVPVGRLLLVPGGYLGLDMFFVLSGFLITSLLLGDQDRSGRVRFGAFYRRRALRLLPALAAMLAAFVTYRLVVGLADRTDRETILSVLFYVSNWRQSWSQPVSGGLRHLWSLSVEEQFYLVWPIVVAVLVGARRRGSIAVGLTVAGIVAVAVVRARSWSEPLSFVRLYPRTDMRADALLMGALAAQLWARGWVPRRAVRALAWPSAALLAWAVATVGPERAVLYRGLFTVLAAAFAVLLLASVERLWVGGRLLETGLLRLIGRVSYGIYLWHFPIYVAVSREAASLPTAVQVAIAWNLTALATTVSWLAIERPALRLKDRRPGAPAVATAGWTAAVAAGPPGARRKPIRRPVTVLAPEVSGAR